MSDEMDAATLGSLLADDCARTIVEATAREPQSADALAEQCEASKTTVYRRLEELEEHDLVEVRRRPEEQGHHYKVYAARLDRAVVTLTDDGIELSVTRRDRMTERFRRFVEEL
ncbi:helix-turn-helix domain-containing protein [Halolamina sp. CBA1230]|uniref:ArsR/SmtB family transcription factor n=1 Tax=Halolamina sp. CBA1230 TaxID=1853690 RepID=UPI001C3C559C|nr:helix-turn-helix domain-containing protein [Halolamina sp. CBA1230]